MYCAMHCAMHRAMDRAMHCAMHCAMHHAMHCAMHRAMHRAVAPQVHHIAALRQLHVQGARVRQPRARSVGTEVARGLAFQWRQRRGGGRGGGRRGQLPDLAAAQF